MVIETLGHPTGTSGLFKQPSRCASQTVRGARTTWAGLTKMQIQWVCSGLSTQPFYLLLAMWVLLLCMEGPRRILRGFMFILHNSRLLCQSVLCFLPEAGSSPPPHREPQSGGSCSSVCRNNQKHKIQRLLEKHSCLNQSRLGGIWCTNDFLSRVHIIFY